MQHITPDILAKLKAALLEQRKKLTEVQRGVDEENPVNDESRITNNASPDADASEEVSIITSEVVGNQISESLSRIDSALKRMEAGEYGLDVVTGEPIPVERLLVDPTATHNVQKTM